MRMGQDCGLTQVTLNTSEQDPAGPSSDSVDPSNPFRRISLYPFINCELELKVRWKRTFVVAEARAIRPASVPNRAKAVSGNKQK